LRVSRRRCLLLDWIKKCGLTQTEYARRAGRSQRMISYFCNNERPMHPEDMYIAEKILGCTWDQLYEIVEE
jgi:transcriptional regulator with XRE-family HTH domain